MYSLVTLINKTILYIWRLPLWLSCQKICLQCRRPGLDLWLGKIPWKRKWQPTPGFLLENPMDREAWQATGHGVAEESGMTEWLTLSHFHNIVWSLKGKNFPQNERNSMIKSETGRGVEVGRSLKYSLKIWILYRKNNF